MTSPPSLPVEPVSSEWPLPSNPEEAFKHVTSALADSEYTLTRAGELVEDLNARRTIEAMREKRAAMMRRVLDLGAEASLDESGETATGPADAVRNLWMGIESAIGGDPLVLETVQGEEAKAIKRLEAALGHGFSQSMDQALRDVVSEMEADGRTLKELQDGSEV